MSNPTVPASPGFYLLHDIPGYHDDDGEDPGFVDKFPIVAWEIKEGAAWAMTLEGAMKDTEWQAILGPNGAVWWQGV